MGKLATLPRMATYAPQWSAMNDLTFFSHQIRRALHELAQPLAIIAGAVDLLLYEVQDNSEPPPELVQVSRCLQQIIDLVNELRRLAQQLQKPRPDN